MKIKKIVSLILFCSLVHNQIALCMMNKKDKPVEIVIEIPEIEKMIAKGKVLCELPDEILLEIFSYLNDEEKRETMRFVNREFDRIWRSDFFMKRDDFDFEVKEDFFDKEKVANKEFERYITFLKDNKKSIVDCVKHDKLERKLKVHYKGEMFNEIVGVKNKNFEKKFKKIIKQAKDRRYPIRKELRECCQMFLLILLVVIILMLVAVGFGLGLGFGLKESIQRNLIEQCPDPSIYNCRTTACDIELCRSCRETCDALSGIPDWADFCGFYFPWSCKNI